ncbi:hypothetical protein [Streptacidiphilus sp. PAMC 29251]
MIVEQLLELLPVVTGADRSTVGAAEHEVVVLPGLAGGSPLLLLLLPGLLKDGDERRRDGDKTGHYTEADAIRWTTTGEPVATRTDAPVALADRCGGAPRLFMAA